MSNSQSPVLAIIPGGPGLTSVSLKGLIDLEFSHDVIAVNPNPSASDFSYESQVTHIEAVLRNLGRPVILCGHSAGGIYATDLASRLGKLASALICIATPFSKLTWESVFEIYADSMNPKLKAAEEEFSAAPSRQTFNRWLATYGSLYFSKDFLDSGREMLLNENSVFQAYLGATDAVATREDLLSVARALDIPKLFIAGESDQLVPLKNAREDASSGGFRFKTVENAGHFVTLERPTIIQELITGFLEQQPKGIL